jgi:hypothetical protein
MPKVPLTRQSVVLAQVTEVSPWESFDICWLYQFVPLFTVARAILFCDITTHAIALAQLIDVTLSGAELGATFDQAVPELVVKSITPTPPLVLPAT